jgi:dihydroflavonol-4-reductase
MILVTGATGFVGFHLLLELSDSSVPVRAIYRSEAKLKATKERFSQVNKLQEFSKIEWIKADVLDIPSLEIAFKNCTHVYHTAALVSFDPKDREQLNTVNIEGTANIVNLCLEHDIQKLGFVSSIAALGNGFSPDYLVNEETDRNFELIASDYAYSKYFSELEVWRGYQEGLPVVIINPGVILGDHFPDEGSALIKQRVKRGLKYFTDGYLGIVAVEDVVSALALLMQANISGERYICVAQDVLYKDFFNWIALANNKKAPRTKIPYSIIKILYNLDAFLSLFTRKRQLTKAIANALYNKGRHDVSKLKSIYTFKYLDMVDYVKDWSRK